MAQILRRGCLPGSARCPCLPHGARGLGVLLGCRMLLSALVSVGRAGVLLGAPLLASKRGERQWFPFRVVWR